MTENIAVDHDHRSGYTIEINAANTITAMKMEDNQHREDEDDQQSEPQNAMGYANVPRVLAP